MVNSTLFWLLLIPLFMSVITVFVLMKKKADAKEIALFTVGGFLISALIISAAFFIAKGSKTSDTEIWNGEIVSKERLHGSYVESYQCNCTTSRDSKGNTTTSCQTCYRDHFTVTWKAHANVGHFTLKHLDETDDDVYRTPDPREYTNVRKGDPCAVTNQYTNYIKAVPESLFHPVDGSVREQFKNMIPEYPLDIYNRWKVDRVLAVGVKVPNLREWNDKLSESLKKLGPAKQANVVVVLVNTADPTYGFALQDAWLNGKKNDVIVVIGATKFPSKPDFVHILTLTNNEMFKVKLQDHLMEMEELTADSAISVIEKDTLQYHQRKRMKEFAYLDAEIDPPTWVNVTVGVLIVLAYFGFWAWRLEVFGAQTARYNSNRNRRFR
jgi:hypothetical protein